MGIAREVLELASPEIHRGARPKESGIPTPGGLEIKSVMQPLAYAFQAAAAGIRAGHAHHVAAKHFHMPDVIEALGLKVR